MDRRRASCLLRDVVKAAGTSKLCDSRRDLVTYTSGMGGQILNGVRMVAQVCVGAASPFLRLLLLSVFSKNTRALNETALLLRHGHASIHIWMSGQCEKTRLSGICARMISHGWRCNLWKACRAK